MAESDHQLTGELIEACERGELEIVQDLISRGANPSSSDSVGRTPLHSASWYVYIIMCVFSQEFN